MNKPHPHADLIHAWADGAEIEIQDTSGKWFPRTDPTWIRTRQYRIKPAKREARRFCLTVDRDDVRWCRIELMSSATIHGGEIISVVEVLPDEQ